MHESTIHAAYAAARDALAQQGINTEAALAALEATTLSLPCWQGDDVTGLEADASGASGGIAATGNYPGRARNGDELRADLALALSLVPGRNKISLHASYAENTGKRDRDAYDAGDFSRWIDWAKAQNIGLDFNPTFFSHRLAQDTTLSSPDEGVRRFWIAHGIASRNITAAMAKALGMPCVNNLWIPDGMKDDTPNRLAYRQRLAASLDAVYAKPYDNGAQAVDAVESKLFGLGSEAYVVGSHEFYMGYAQSVTARGVPVIPTLDLGHFHPTEQIADKISAMLLFHPSLLLHISRGVRWDSDHVAVFSDDLVRVMREIHRADAAGRVYFGLDFFDASINRIAALVIGARAVQRARLASLLEPVAALRDAEARGDYAARLAAIDACATSPVAAVYDEYCLRSGKAPGIAWLADVAAYERDVQSKRG